MRVILRPQTTVWGGITVIDPPERKPFVIEFRKFIYNVLAFIKGKRRAFIQVPVTISPCFP